MLTKYEPNSMIGKYQKTRTISLRSKRSNWLAQPNNIWIHVNLDNDNLYRKINLYCYWHTLYNWKNIIMKRDLTYMARSQFYWSLTCYHSTVPCDVFFNFKSRSFLNRKLKLLTTRNKSSTTFVMIEERIW